MRECWLRPNRRVLVLAIGLHLLIALLASLLATGLWFPKSPLSLKVCVGIVAVWTWIRTVLRIRDACLPRVAYQQGEVLFFLRNLRALRVPVAEVECFFLGQTDSMLASSTATEPSAGVLKTRAVVVRLAEPATAWHSRDIRRELGVWADGYITIRGTWCEPMTADLVKGLNSRLAKIHRQRRQEGSSS